MTAVDTTQTPAPAVDTTQTPAPALTTPWRRLRELSPTASQQVFRACMNAVARPGTVHRLPVGELPVGVPAVALPLLALADIMTPVAAVATGAEDDQARSAITEIARIVGARLVDADAARYVLVLGETAQIDVVSPGSHWSPETGATVVQRVAGFSSESPAWRLTGPGVPPHAPVEVCVDGLGEVFVSAREALVADYPAGVDCFLVTDDGELMALSRTTRIEMI